VGRSQVRRILLSERLRWRRTRSWATSTDPDVAPKGTGHRLLHQAARGDDGALCRRARPGHPPQLPTRARLDPDGHRVKAPLDDGRGPAKTWVDGACA
jgi:hypothetical protein